MDEVIDQPVSRALVSVLPGSLDLDPVPQWRGANQTKPSVLLECGARPTGLDPQIWQQARSSARYELPVASSGAADPYAIPSPIFE